LQIILFQEQIFERLSLREKERKFGADSGQKYEDLIQKYEANQSEGLARPQTSFCVFCFFDKLPI